MGEKPVGGQTGMKRVFISVEGQTEETFVKEILVPHLESFQVYPVPIILSTKRTRQGNKFKGGITRFQRIQNEINLLLRDTDVSAVTSMYDLYKFPADFPGYDEAPRGDCYQRVAYLENEFTKLISDPRFRPYIQLHEFEALLFVNLSAISKAFPGTNKLAELERIKSAFSSPEEINEGEQTAPSKRILHLFPDYQKPLHGVLISIDTGLDNIRSECGHFNDWITWLESLND